MIFIKKRSEWDPFRELERYSSFENCGPALDVEETKNSVLVKADLPGLKKEDIQVSVEDGFLTLRGEKKQEERKEESNLIREERWYGIFERVIELPNTVDAERVKAVYKNGVLELSFPKKEEAKPKQIQISVE